MNILDDFENIPAEPLALKNNTSTPEALGYTQISTKSELDALLADTNEAALKLTAFPCQFLMATDKGLFLLDEFEANEPLLEHLLASQATVVMLDAYAAKRQLKRHLTRNVECLRIMHNITRTTFIPSSISASSMLALYHQQMELIDHLGCRDWYEKLKATQFLGNTASFDIDRDVYDSVLAEWRESPSKEGKVTEWRNKLVDSSLRRVWGYTPADQEDANLVRMLQVHLVPNGQPQTGRFSSENPYMHDIPKDLRKAFMAPGYFRKRRTPDAQLLPDSSPVLVSCDFRQSQPRILYSLSHDEVYGAPLLDGSDIYKHCAATLFGKAYEDITDVERSVGKVVCLGIPYGMQSETLGDTLKEAGLEYPESEVSHMHAAFCKKYEQLFSWIQGLPDNEDFVVPFDSPKGKYALKTPSGRMIPLSEKYTARRNGSVLATLLAQAIEVEIIVDAILRFSQREGHMEKHYGQVLHVMHDELLVHVNSSFSTQCRNRLGTAMTQAFLAYPGMVKMENVVEVSEAKPCWGNLKG